MNTSPSPTQVLHATPTWVFGLFLLLLWMGLRQLAPGRPHWRRAVLVPLVMAGLSLYGAFTTLGEAPGALVAWALSAAVAGTLMFRRPLPPGVRYRQDEQRFTMPGSAVPLALMMGVFCTRFATAMALALHPALRHDAGVLLLIGLSYGAFGGVFAGRAARLVVLAQRRELPLAH